MKTGAYYWNGWSDEKTFALTEKLKTEFSDREPVWGWISNTVENMELQIEHANKGGINFFAFDWYYLESEDKHTFMNDATDLFLEAANRDKMEFCLLIANHQGSRIFKKDWDIVIELWMKYLTEKNYLMVDGKPLIIIFSPQEMTECMGGPDSVKEAFNKLQSRVKEAGLPGVAIAACYASLNSEESINRVKLCEYEGYTHFTGYNYNEYRFKGDKPVQQSYYEFVNKLGDLDQKYIPKRIQPFGDLIEKHLEIWENFASFSSIPYLPCITCGWDCRPWEVPEKVELHSWYYPDRTPEQLADLIKKAEEWMESHPLNTTKENIVLLYAWNEFGEGGYIAPTKGDNGRYLEMISNINKHETSRDVDNQTGE
jgi:hypothetical protein